MSKLSKFVALAAIAVSIAIANPNGNAVFAAPATTATPTVTTAAPAQKYVIYIRDGCIHCTNVEAFVTRNNIGDKIDYRNISSSAAFEQEMTALYTTYKSSDQPGTPTMASDGKLYVGDTPIVDYLKQKLSIVDNTPIDATSTTTPDVKPLGVGDIALLAIGGLVLATIVGYGIYSSVKKD